jgi:hypothetical protein
MSVIAAAQEVAPVEVSGRTFRAIEVAVKELEGKVGWPVEDFAIVVYVLKDRTTVSFQDPESRGMGGGGFTVEMRTDSLKVERSGFYR